MIQSFFLHLYQNNPLLAFVDDITPANFSFETTPVANATY